MADMEFDTPADAIQFAFNEIGALKLKVGALQVATNYLIHDSLGPNPSNEAYNALVSRIASFSRRAGHTEVAAMIVEMFIATDGPAELLQFPTEG